MKPKAQPFPRQDSRQAKDARAARSRMETWPTRHPRVTASPACALTRARPTPQRQARTPLAADCDDGLEAWRGSSIGKAGWRVGEPSFVTYRREPPASRTARFGTTCRSKPGRSPTSPAHCGGAPSKPCPRQRAPIAVLRARHLRARSVAAWSKAATGRFWCGR